MNIVLIIALGLFLMLMIYIAVFYLSRYECIEVYAKTSNPEKRKECFDAKGSEWIAPDIDIEAIIYR